MKFISLILCFYITQGYAEPEKTSQSRLAMGFYYPSLRSTSRQTDIQVSLNYWVQELTSSLNPGSVNSLLYEDINKMSKAFSEGKLDLIVAPPLLLTIHFDRSLLSNGFIAVNERGKTDQLIIIANQDPKQVFDGFNKKRLLLPQDNLLAEVFLDSEVIKRHQQPYQQVFSQITYGDKNQRMILDLFFDKADIAVVYQSALETMFEMNPQLTKKIKKISMFPIKSRDYSFFHKQYFYQQTLKDKTETFRASVRGKQILQVFHASDIDTCLVSDLDQFDDLYATYRQLKKQLADD